MCCSLDIRTHWRLTYITCSLIFRLCVINDLATNNQQPGAILEKYVSPTAKPFLPTLLILFLLHLLSSSVLVPFLSQSLLVHLFFLNKQIKETKTGVCFPHAVLIWLVCVRWGIALLSYEQMFSLIRSTWTRLWEKCKTETGTFRAVLESLCHLNKQVNMYYCPLEKLGSSTGGWGGAAALKQVNKNNKRIIRIIRQTRTHSERCSIANGAHLWKTVTAKCEWVREWGTISA